MPDFTIAYNTCPEHDPAYCNQCAEDAYFVRPTTYKITFNTPSDFRPQSYTHMTFKNAGALIEYVEKWEIEPPLFAWNIQSIEQVERISKPIVQADYWMEDNLRAPAQSALERMGYV